MISSSKGLQSCSPRRDTGQAQYIRIPYADFNALKLPSGKEHESDFILLAGMIPSIFFNVCAAYSNHRE